MGTVILDTNVIVIANGMSRQASCDCVRRCRERLDQIRKGSEKVVLDYEQQILREYRRNLREAGRLQRRRGDLFLQWLKQNQWKPEKCSLVHITSLAGNGNDFAEFPNDDEALTDFHKKDRKFIAVALAHQRDFGETPTILLAIDKGWVPFTAALANHKIRVDLICEEDVQHSHQERTEK